MLIKKAVAVRKHLQTNRKDKDSKLYVNPNLQYCSLLINPAVSFSSSPVFTAFPATTRPSVSFPQLGGTRVPLPLLLSHKGALISVGWLERTKHSSGVMDAWVLYGLHSLNRHGWT